MNADVIANMRSRVARFRRLSAMMTDKRAIEVLEEIGREAEEDIRRLEERAGDGPQVGEQPRD